MWKFVDKNWYVRLNDGILVSLINKGIKKAGSIKNLIQKLGINYNTIEGWKRGKSPKIADLYKLAKFLGLPISQLRKEIIQLKKGKRSNFIFTREMIIDNKFIQVYGFLQGDGSLDKYKIRASNSEFKPLRYFINFLERFGFDRNAVKVYVTVPRSVILTPQKKEEIKRRWATELRIPITNIISVKRKHKTYIKSKKDYAEVYCCSNTLSFIFRKLAPSIKKFFLESQEFQICYLQGIFAAEGSVTHRKKNKYRAVQINMKNRKEMNFIAKLLSNFDIIFFGPKEHNGAWHITITNRQNLEKLASIDIFELHPSRKSKLENILQAYQRRQAVAHKKQARFSQIVKKLKVGKKVAKEIADQLDISLCRAQVLLKKGYDDGLWKRKRMKGHKSPYVYFLQNL